MKPILFHVGTYPVYAYGFMICIGFIAAMTIAYYRLKQKGFDPSLVFDFAIICLLSGILGARIFFLVQYNHYFDFTIFNIFEGISASGGILGILFFLACYKNTKAIFAIGIQTFILLSAIHHNKATWIFPLEILFLALLAFFAIQNAKIAILSFNQGNKALFSLWFVFCFVSGLRGMHCYYLRSQYSWDVFALWKGGLVFFGGFILAVAVLALYCQKKKIPLLPLFDILTFSVAIALSFARIGCFLNGCCYGKVCHEESPLAVHFPSDSIVSERVHIATLDIDSLWKKHAPKEIHFWSELPHGKRRILQNFPKYLPPDIYHSIFRPVYATQIVSSFKGILLFFLLCWFYPRRRYEGETTLFFCMFYSIGRFSVEMLRGDTPPFLGTSLTAGQFVSVCLFCLCASLFLYFRFMPKVRKG
ncbi:MAG: prolipoprotein diacylglyceryl transferase [Candidatus Brocadiae bacterium]|nr:prolipoprotein diacylglyceryl transferase [Candidatus Brocadiia bacterium]